MEDGFSSLSVADFGIGGWNNLNNPDALKTGYRRIERPHPAGFTETLLPADHCHHRSAQANHTPAQFKDNSGTSFKLQPQNDGKIHLHSLPISTQPEVPSIPPPPPLPPPPVPNISSSGAKDNFPLPERMAPPGDNTHVSVIQQAARSAIEYPCVEVSRRQACHVTTIYVPPPEGLADTRLPVLDALSSSSGPVPPHLRYSRTPSLTPLSSLAPVVPRGATSHHGRQDNGVDDQPKVPGSDSPTDQSRKKDRSLEMGRKGSKKFHSDAFSVDPDNAGVYVRSYVRNVPDPYAMNNNLPQKQSSPSKSRAVGGNWTLTERAGAPDGMAASDEEPRSEAAAPTSTTQPNDYLDAPNAYVNHSFNDSENSAVNAINDVIVHVEDDPEISIVKTDKKPIAVVSGETPKKAENHHENKVSNSGSPSLAIERSQEMLDEEAKWLQWMEAKFSDIAGEDGEIDLAEFKTALGVKKSFFAERFFALFDQDGSGSIEMTELMDGLKMLTNGTPKQKLKFLFDVYDVDGGGSIDFDELKTVLASCMDESSLQLSEDSLNRLTAALFESADEDGSGAITFEELVEELEKFPGVLENLTISAANWLKPPPEKKKKRFTIPRYFTKRYIMNNMKKVMFFLIYWLLNIGLFALNAWRYWDNNAYVIIARGAGMCLNFNGMFILVLMLRACLTWLRTTRIGPYLPLDQSILFHKMVGLSLAFFTFVHTVAHLANIAVVMQNAQQPNTTVPAHLQELQYWEFLFTLRSRIGWIGPGFGYLSGVLLDVILAIMVICSMPFIRRGGHFQIFYFTHMLYVPFWVLLILHGPIFWYFFIVPGFLFILERINVSKVYKLARYGHVKIKEVNLLPSRVTNLVIGRPSKFRYKPGDYIFVNIPVIAQYEWHPFTVSSAPEHESEVWLHVRSVGHWTNKLYDYFDALPDINENRKVPEITDGKSMKGTPKKSFQHKKKIVNVEIYIDGPYGTSTREIFDSEHAVLIASGIGVTPYASILQSVHKRYMAYKRSCPKCTHEWYGEVPSHVMKLKKVDFIWINRDQKCFEWFCELLSKLEVSSETDDMTEEQIEESRFISMHMYITSALGKTDMKGIGLQMAMEILHKKEGRDLITGLRCRTQAGRPDWKELFKQIEARKKGKVNVFFCGSPQLAKSLKQHSENIGFNFNKENF